MGRYAGKSTLGCELRHTSVWLQNDRCDLNSQNAGHVLRTRVGWCYKFTGLQSKPLHDDRVADHKPRIVPQFFTLRKNSRGRPGPVGQGCTGCGSYGPFEVLVSMRVLLHDSGTEDAKDGSTWYDRDALTKCDSCRHEGRFGDFDEKPQ